MTQNGGDSREDLDLEGQLWEECAGACDALAGAIRRAKATMPGLPRPARQVARGQLTGIARRTCLLLLAVGFPEQPVTEKEK